MFSFIKPKSCIILLLGSTILAFGLYNIHSMSGVTEGGVLGLTLLLDHWFGISPSVSSFVLSLICYLMGFKILGKEFIANSIVATCGFSIAYKICEQFDPLWPQLAQMPMTAALAGALFVGIGVGICVRTGGAPGGDDALSMTLSHVTHLNIEWIYLICDLIVLGFSISYIPLKKLGFSLLTVILSGQIVGWIQRVNFRVCTKKSPPAVK